MIFFLFIFLIPINLTFLTLDKNNIVIKDNTLSEINDLKLSGVSGKINIVGQQGWIDFKDDGNCTGSGTYYDPYVIKDLIIDGHGSGAGIKINLSRNYFFRIENCTIFNCWYGIELISTDNGTLYQNDCSFNGYGIYLHCPNPATQETYGCFNNTIIENIANNGTYGIHLDWGSSGNLINNTANNNNRGIFHAGYPHIISGNTINNNGYSGISLWGPGSGSNSKISGNIAIDNRDCGIDILSFGFNLTGNFMVGSGIILWHQSIERLSQISIDTTNFVNNKPIYYLINKTNNTPQNLEDAGQIFLINCRNILVKDIDVSDSSYGINIYDSNNITMLNAVSSNNNYGISLRNTNNSFIINSTLKYNKK
jgi:parallel beta-helix repeat protein